MIRSPLQDSTALADQREGKGSERQQTFFSIGRITATLSGCCCQKGENLTNLLSTSAASSPLLPSHLLSLADTQWCPSDWNSHDPSSLFLPWPWMWLQTGSEECSSVTKEVTEVCIKNREEETAGIPCYQPLSSTRFNQVTSCNFNLFGTIQGFRI